MKDKEQDADPQRPQAPGPGPQAPGDNAAYEPPALRKYGSLADLTRSGTGTAMEGGKGPPRDFA